MKGGETVQDIKTIAERLDTLVNQVSTIGALANYDGERNNPILDAIQIIAAYTTEELDNVVMSLSEHIEADGKG